MQYSAHEARSSESLNKVTSFSSYVQNQSAEAKSIAKSPNRKRRVLHRMSSSLQCCDDENCEDIDRFNVPEEFQFPPTNPFASVEIPPKPALRATQSNLSRTPGHRPVLPCSSLPAVIKSCSSCETQNELGCAARWWKGQSSSDPEESRFHNRRREKRNCKKRRYLSCPSPGATFNFNPWMNVGLPLSGTCGAETNRCRYLSESGSVSEMRAFPGRPVDHANMRFNERHAGWDNCVCYEDCTCVNCHNFPDVRLLPALPSRRNSRRCTWNSTPDVRCAHWNSFPKEYFAEPPVNSLSDPSVMRSGNLGAPSSFYEEDEIERRDCSCFLQREDPPDNAQAQRNKRLRVRTPQRQNSMSIDDPDEESLPNWNNPCQDSIPNRNGYFLDSRRPRASPPFDASRKAGAAAPRQNMSDLNSRREKVSLRREAGSDKIHQLSSTTSNIKNEAMMERKIRIFSKFFTNLGNLSKSIQDKSSDTSKQKERAISGSDKPLQWDAREAVPPGNSCFTPPQELDPFFETGSGNAPDSETCNEVVRCGSELNYPIYENRVLLQTNPKVEGHQKRFKPVQFTSSVSMYINSEENNVDFSFCRKECSVVEAGLGRDSASTKSDEGSRPSSQMSFKVVSKELEDLQQSIQKAKEMRISASKELHLLQEILAGDDSSEGKSEEIRQPTVYPRKENTVRSAAMREHQQTIISTHAFIADDHSLQPTRAPFGEVLDGLAIFPESFIATPTSHGHQAAHASVVEIFAVVLLIYDLNYIPV
ncbi:uncharacterized protein CEXT_6511 [Caerostris extrusa]|uniref:Uncharacterized protein n=1 Tax=Caerostris extrusa TaxID=172846 RepID=A0AAV4U4P0_CAEEX|nr:uncharacterized protein CEXT_6511 [Caerostris extrusa]